MKRTILIVLAVLFLGASGLASRVYSQAVPVADNSAPMSELVEVIDDIEVPYHVLESIHAEFPAHAVTEAKRVTKNAKEAYRLRADRDSTPDDADSHYLFFDKQWNLITKEKTTESREEAPVRTEKKLESDRVEQREERRGGGNSGPSPRQETDDKPEPQPAPSPEPTPEEPSDGGLGGD